MGGRGASSTSGYNSVPTLTSQQKDSVEFYGAAGYQNINSGLRNGTVLTSSDKSHIRNLKEATNSSLKKDFTAYRGMTDPALDRIIERGASLSGAPLLLKDRSFTSTTTNKDVVEFFGGSTLATIKVPKGTKGRHISGEDEVLLHPGTTFKVNAYKVLSPGDVGFGRFKYSASPEVVLPKTRKKS